jgi:hypothetical protein
VRNQDLASDQVNETMEQEFRTRDPFAVGSHVYIKEHEPPFRQGDRVKIFSVEDDMVTVGIEHAHTHRRKVGEVHKDNLSRVPTIPLGRTTSPPPSRPVTVASVRG